MVNNSNNDATAFLRMMLTELGEDSIAQLIEWRRRCIRYMTAAASGKYTIILSYLTDLNNDIDNPPARPELEGLTDEQITTVWMSLLNTHLKNKGEREVARRAFFEVMMGQTGGALRSELHSLADFDTRQSTGDIIWLWMTIEELVSGAHVGRNWPPMVVLRQMTRIINITQGSNESLEDYHHRFNTEVEGTINAGINLGAHPLLAEMGNLFADNGEADDAVLVAAWLRGLRNKFSSYNDALHNNYLINRGFTYPRNLGEALAGVLTFVHERSANADGSRQGVTFNQGNQG
mmetsp:Transcript_1115/g.1749  ORF Transcript_1115/g.1749 Transcript_1115/m.1749 type:complete len:291 (+) Transcript_1115:1852-2724(+)